MNAPQPKSTQPALSTYGWVGLGSLLVGVVVWDVLARTSELPAFILPTPARVAERFWMTLLDGSLARHTAVTLLEVFLGLNVGLAAGAVLGYLTAKSPTLERWLTPYIVASQAVPIAAIAPLLVIWLGPGLISKVVTCALIVFFPILVNTLTGLRTVDVHLREILESYNANRWQTFIKLEFPAALPVLLGGLKVGATLAVIGAVVGEFVGADRGLGFLINAGRGAFDTALVFVAVGALVVLAVSLYGGVVLLERVLLHGRPG